MPKYYALLQFVSLRLIKKTSHFLPRFSSYIRVHVCVCVSVCVSLCMCLYSIARFLYSVFLCFQITKTCCNRRHFDLLYTIYYLCIEDNYFSLLINLLYIYIYIYIFSVCRFIFTTKASCCRNIEIVLHLSVCIMFSV